MSKKNRVKFEEYIQGTNWKDLVNSETDLDHSANLLLNCLSALFDYYFPTKTVRLRSDDPPWMRPSLKLFINDRDRAWKNKQWDMYRRLRDEVASEVKRLKSEYLLTAASSGNAKDTWDRLRLISRYNKKPISKLNIDCERLNSHFSSNFQNDIEPAPLLPTCHHSSLDNCTIMSVEEVETHLRKLKRKSCGPDCIPFCVLRDYSSNLAPAITCIFNRSITTSYVPKCFKMANIHPIPKVKNPIEPQDFRPISLLPIISKTLEKLMLHKFILTNISGKTDNSQFAHIPKVGSGTSSALTLIYHRIANFLDASPGTVLKLTVDFSKAFDKLTHSSILSAAIRLGIPEATVLWIRSFLSDRMQRVSVGNATSSWTTVRSGVPQGSVIGPVLFCLATDSISPCSNNTSITKYADDITFLHFIRDVSEDRLQNEWDRLVEWSNTNKLPINASKCFVMDFVTKKYPVLPPILDQDRRPL